MSLKPRTVDQAVRGFTWTLVRLLPAVLVLFASLFTLTTPALAGLPFHSPLPNPIGGFPLNHACGTAVDSEGDIYVSNAGEAKVEVFDPAGTHLTSISNANGPCALAVDSNGNLYVSEQATGKVLRYTPNAYPFSGTPSYGAPTTIDPSGNAKGIAVDSFDDRLYVAEGNRIATYSSEGTPGINESQRVRVTEKVNEVETGGTYRLSFEGQETAPIPAGASHAQVQEALEAISTIGVGNVAVTQAEGSSSPTNHLITFKGALRGVDVPQAFPVSGLSPSQVNSLTVNATAGTYTLTMGTGEGAGTLTSGSNEISGVTAYFGAFHVGDAITGSGIPAGTTITEVGSGTLKLSENATESRVEQRVNTTETTLPIAYNATAGGVQAALEALAGVSSGDVSVSGGPGGPGGSTPYTIAFEGAYAGRFVSLTPDQSALSGTATIAVTTSPAGFFFTTVTQGWDGHIAEGELSGATGVAAYSYGPFEHYLSAAEPSQGKIEILRSSYGISELEPRATIDGSETPAGELGLAATGAYLGVDPKSGHLFSYDATHKVLDEFEATGHYFTQIADPAFEDAKPTAIAVDRSGGTGDGTVYATAGAKLLAFGAVVPPGRASLESLSHQFPKACGAAVDSQGDLYLAGETEIKVYGPQGNPIEVTDSEGHKGRIVADHPCDLAVDSEGNLYAALRGAPVSGGDEKVLLYKPSSYPFSGPPSYGAATTIETIEWPRGIAVDPADDHLFTVHDVGGAEAGVHEYDSAANGSALLKTEFCGLFGSLYGIDVYGATGDVYVVSGTNSVINVCNPAGTKVLTEIDGSGSPGGKFSALIDKRIAVDQANGHVLVGEMGPRGVVEEFDSSGAFVGQYGSFNAGASQSDLAIDNSGGPTEGNLYVAYDDPTPNTFDLTAFGPLAYGEPPVAVTGTASAVGGGNATLNGTVDPRGFELTACRFEYLTDAEYGSNGETFAGAESKACAESLAEIGKGSAPVAVHAALSGLDPGGRYRYRLLTENEFGSSPGTAGLFGPPLITVKSAQPILYREATLRGEIDPSGLQTKYHFEYLTDAEYQANGETFTGSQSTPIQTLSPSSPPTAVEAFLTGLAEATTYRFRLLAENEAMPVEGPVQTFSTLERRSHPPCPNETLRFEDNSSNLPDCRAYELVTPADTRGATPRAVNAGGSSMFNNWLTTPSGPLAGESLAFFLNATLPGTEGTGLFDAFRASRGSAGWGSELFGPSNAQIGYAHDQEGVSPDQLYSFWHLGSATPGPGTFLLGHYLRTPGGFEALGEGSLGTDPQAEGMYISAGGTHVIFATKEPSAVQLEPEAPPAPIGAVYDRSPGGPTHVVSLLPGEVTPASSATYDGSTPDGSAVVFTVAGKLYLRLDNAETVEVAPAGGFSGISDDGERVFYESGGNLHVFDVEGNTATQLAVNAKFVDVSADGSHAYFTSEDDLSGAEENEAGEEAEAGKHNLYVWEGSSIRFVAILDATDLQKAGSIHFPGTATFDQVGLDAWTAQCVNPNLVGGARGRAFCPSRSTPDGRFLVFQSHADLAPPYEGNGHSEIYRYDSVEESLLCVSCDPSGAPARAEADLQSFVSPSTTWATTLIPSITEDGGRIFFQTAAALLPEDANSVLDVYEWQAPGTPECARPSGCLALISSGQSDSPSTIYSMTPDGHDVFFSTVEKLVGADIAGSPSIYDARVEGGFPNPPAPEPCHGDACQGEGAAAPGRVVARSDIPGSGNFEAPPKLHCRKGLHRVRRAGKARCVKPHHKRHRHARHKRRAGR